jgi:P pilus assembly chaperone PapD
VLFQFSVPVFAGNEGPSEHHGLAWQLSKSGSGETLSVRSEGTTYSKLSGLKIVPASGSSVDVGHGQIVYVLPGASEHWDVAGLSVTQGEKLRVEAYDDRHHREVTFPVTAGL